MDRLDHLVEAVAVARVACGVVLAAAGEMRRDVRILDLVLRARDDAHPGLAELLDGREQDDVVDADEVGLDLGQHARQVLLRPLGAVDDRRPAVLHVVVDLVVGRLAEVRDVAVDEVLPELRHLLGRHRLGEVHRVRLEAVALVDVDEAGIGEEHGLVAERLDGLRDADGVERRAVGGLGKKAMVFCALIGRFLSSLATADVPLVSIFDVIRIGAATQPVARLRLDALGLGGGETGDQALTASRNFEDRLDVGAVEHGLDHPGFERTEQRAIRDRASAAPA